MIVPYWKTGLYASYLKDKYGFLFYEACAELGPPTYLYKGAAGTYELSYVFVLREPTDVSEQAEDRFFRFDMRCLADDPDYVEFVWRHGYTSTSESQHKTNMNKWIARVIEFTRSPRWVNAKAGSILSDVDFDDLFDD